MYKMKLTKGINTVWLTLAVALFFILFLNMSLLRELVHIFSAFEELDYVFITTIFFFFLAVFNIVFTLLAIPRLEKPIFILLIIMSSIVNFAMYHYKIIFDPDMITNIVETDIAESSSYLNMSLIWWFILTAIFPSTAIAFITIKRTPILLDIGYKALSILASLLVIGVIALFFYKDYVYVARNNSHLRKQINPSYYLTSSFKYIKHTYFDEGLPYKQIGLDAHQLDNKNGLKNLSIFIVGETARAQDYELNGYDRPTNSYTRNIKNLISFKNVRSCGTATAVSVPCMFSFQNKNNYSKKETEAQDNVIDVIARSNYDVLWEENNSGCKGVCNHVETIKLEYDDRFCANLTCTDDIFLKDLEGRIEKMSDNGGIIFLHIMGSHGPTYNERVPDSYKKFFPECDRSDLQNCSDVEIKNSYDNTILFTDYIVNRTIETLKNYEDQLNASLIYVSDHGESLGENGLYLHGLPYSVAPETQTTVPFFLWLSDNKIKADNIDMTCLKEKAATNAISHDYISHSLLSLMNIKTKIYKEDLDIFKGCK